MFRTTHVAECPEVAPECASVEIPPHLHDVSLALTHLEAVVEYGWKPSVVLSLRLPHDVKAMDVRYETLDGAPYDPPYGDIHHRTETLRGLGDPELFLSLHRKGLTGTKDLWSLGLGTTLPLGSTVEDPVRLGEQGRRHQHIQFGSGSFDPRLRLGWSRPAGPLTLRANAELAFSVHESEKGFRAPAALQWAAGASWRWRKLGLLGELEGQLQDRARYHGQIDEGTGFNKGGLSLKASVPLGQGLSLQPSIYGELYSRGFGEETFHQGPTVSLGLSKTLR